MTTDQSLAGITILVVEDDFLIADDLSRELRDEGARVLGPAASLAEGLAQVADQRPDLAVLDIDLDGQPVFPLADALRAQAVPFLFATGLDPEALPERFRDVPRFDKPVRLQAVIAALGVLQLSQATDPGWTDLRPPRAAPD